MALLASAFLAPAAGPSSGIPRANVGDTVQAQIAPAPKSHAEVVSAPAGTVAFGYAAGGALAVLGAVTVRGGRRERRATRAARRFFGTTAAPEVPPKPLAVPVLPEPQYRRLQDPLAVEMDAGFDPLELATRASPWGEGESAYYNYREAEVKHGRLAMLASVGWLTSEELQGAIAKRLGLPDDLANGELAPSIVNGGLGNLPSWFLPAVLVVSAWIEFVPRQQGNREGLLKYTPQRDRVPGDLSFDPLALQGTLAGMGYSLARLHNAEVKHGRAAMIAIAAFVAQEFVSKVDVLSEDEISADRLVAGIDKGIDAIDTLTGASIPDIPMPFSLS